MNKKIVSSALALSLLAVNTISVRATTISENNSSSDSYSNCVNPGRFWNGGIKEEQYRNLYLHVCARVGNLSGNEKSDKNSTGIKLIPTPTVIIIPTETQIPEETETSIPPTNNPTEIPTQKPPVIIITDTPEPTKIPDPTKECKNKNSDKDGTPNECNAGIGQEKKS